MEMVMVVEEEAGNGRLKALMVVGGGGWVGNCDDDGDKRIWRSGGRNEKEMVMVCECMYMYERENGRAK
ncbi:hypothetical protein LguiB_000523 [Lonicera macranthoides]